MGVWACAGALGMPGRVQGFLTRGGAVCGVLRRGATGGRCSYSHGAVLQNNNQPLHLALQQGHVETARMLLEKGAPVDAVDEVSAWVYGRVQEPWACLGECRAF